MAQRLAARGAIDLEALSPRDANAQRMPKVAELKVKAAQFKSAKEKEHPPPPPPHVTEPPSPGFSDGVTYQVGKLLGKGGFAICYVGQQQGTRQRHALKIVKSKMPPKMEQKFQTELQIHSKMRQKNIVQFFRAFTFDQCTYLVLELCPNGSLMDMVKRRKGLTEPEVRFYAVQIAGAIKYMHGKGIIHRDLKMGNIFLDSRMNAKIGDFGLAALVVTGRDMQTIRRTTLCGTPNYIAPEILEKGKKGHDHMVDIWSLGIIMFAMLTSKPPFQSSTTDEIYRRARDRDYEWPDPETTQKYISAEAKDLVATMLESPECRPGPDTIVQHPWFRVGYMPVPADMTPKLRELPPERAEFYMDDLSDRVYAASYNNFRDLCEECMVGPFATRKIIHSQVWKEMAAEEKACLTPMIPLEEGIVYRPFEEWLREQPEKVRSGAARSLQPRLVPAEPSTMSSSVNSSVSSSMSSSTSSAITSVAKAPAGLLRQPPQSFAAQQRAQARPATMAPPTSTMPSSSSTVSRTPRTATVPITSVTTTASAATVTTASVSTNTATITKKQLNPEPQQPESSRQQTLNLQLKAMRDPPPKEQPLRSRSETIPRREPVPALRTRLPGHTRTQSTTTTDRSAKPSETSSAPATLRSRSTEVRTASLFSPTEIPSDIPGTHPDIILDRLRRLQTELERALNARTMAIITSKTATPPAQPQVVVKWVDYTNKYGLGYILNDGSIGCVLRDIPASGEDGREALLPPVCMLVPDAERHFERREDERYAERHQPVPMGGGGVHFFENRGEDGMVHVRVSSEKFRVAVGEDGIPGKLDPGRDAYQYRKRERIILWRKFANYMVVYGRDDGPSVEEERRDSAEVPHPSQLVTFYQRFGDVGCWVFCDGHLQFNFPDHTKIVLDATGTWCHFWHLPQDAATQLAETGTLDPSALDNRGVLSYPLQTLLNFHRSPRPTASASSSRRRPEISPELQGIPAANDFRRKVSFIRTVVAEWVAGGGLGNSDMTPRGRLRWSGYRELREGKTKLKHIWVTVGARQKDVRITSMVDLRRPLEVSEDL